MYKREKTTGKEIIAFDGYWELMADIKDKQWRAQHANGHRPNVIPYVTPVSIPCFISMLQERWLLLWLACRIFDMKERSKVPVLISCGHVISLNKKRCSIWQSISSPSSPSSPPCWCTKQTAPFVMVHQHGRHDIIR